MVKIQTAERNSGQEPSDNVIHHRHLCAYYEAAKFVSGKVLEIGSGEGYGIQILAPSATEYTAIDKHLTPVDTGLDQVVFKQCHVPPFTGIESDTFDFALSFQVIEHIKNDRLFLQEIRRVLKPGGQLLITTPNRLMSLTRNPWHIREYKPAQIKQVLAEVFPGSEIRGVFGNEKVMAYHEQNRLSVRRFTRWDVLNMQYWLPRPLLQIPYDIANRLNRNRLFKSNSGMVNTVTADDFYIGDLSEKCLDFFCIATK